VSVLTSGSTGASLKLHYRFYLSHIVLDAAYLVSGVGYWILVA
jgi:hypothetical protein